MFLPENLPNEPSECFIRGAIAGVVDVVLQVVEQLIAVRITFVEVMAQRPLENIIQGGVDAGIQAAEIGDRHVHDPLTGFLRGIAFENIVAQQKAAENNSGGKKIGSLVRDSKIGLLGAHEVGLARHNFTFLVDQKALGFCDPEIRELHVPFKGDHDVLEADVPMNNSHGTALTVCLRMCVGKAPGDPADNEHCEFPGKDSPFVGQLLGELLQIHPPDQLHGYEKYAASLPKLVGLDNIRMDQIRDEFCLTDEVLDEVLLVGVILPDHLDSHTLDEVTSAMLLGLVNDAHAAFVNLPHDLVMKLVLYRKESHEAMLGKRGMKSSSSPAFAISGQVRAPCFSPCGGAGCGFNTNVPAQSNNSGTTGTKMSKNFFRSLGGIWGGIPQVFSLMAAGAVLIVNAVWAGDIIEPGAAPQKLAGEFKFTEGPSSDAKGNVFFTDQPNDRIMKWGLDGKLSTFKQPCGRANGLCFDRVGNLWACADEKNEIWKIRPDGARQVVLTEYEGHKFNGPNDLWVDPNGGVWFTDPFYKREYWKRGPSELAQNVYYVMGGTRVAAPVIEDLKQPNGIIGTPDGKTLYVADIGAGKIFKYSITTGGVLSGKTLFCEQGSDGMTLDERGNVYLTGRGVSVYDPAGKKIEQIDIPEPWTANACFGGRDHRTLFITATTALYSLEMKVKGAGSQ